MRLLLVALCLFSTVLRPAAAADLVVLVDGPARPAIAAVTEAFRSASGKRLTLIFAAGPALTRMVMDGARADVVIAPRRYVDELEAAAKVSRGDAKPIGSVGYALAVRKGGVPFDVSTAEKLKSALLAADAVVLNNVGSGAYFEAVIDRLELTQVIAGKIVRLAPDAVFDRVASSSMTEIAVGTTPLVLADDRLTPLGEIPPELQSRLELLAAPLAGSGDPNGALALIAYLMAADTQSRLAAAGLK